MVSKPMTGGDDLAWFRRFVESARWRFAKTYVKSYPHEYTVGRWNERGVFWRALHCIERWGVVEPFWRTRRKYLYVDDRKYWHMGDPNSEDPADHPTVINRTWLDISRYRDEARELGWEGEELEELVERWGELLARARGES